MLTAEGAGPGGVNRDRADPQRIRHAAVTPVAPECGAASEAAVLRAQAEADRAQALKEQEEAHARELTEQIYECEFNCGFEGTFESVQGHEQVCPKAAPAASEPDDVGWLAVLRTEGTARMLGIEQVNDAGSIGLSADMLQRRLQSQFGFSQFTANDLVRVVGAQPHPHPHTHPHPLAYPLPR
jgi:hypothetical protein